ncbi:MAG: hypothetical protein DRN91_06010 [Candidatus Alkanophagales archaeon]|nr:MAG: hypothetical protein DRN91_06010 [Candidatus Alkanophagales archaeon]
MELKILYELEEPIPKGDLIEMLKDAGFEEFTEPEKIVIPGIGPLKRVSIAKKGNCVINYDKNVGSISVSGNDFENVYLTFREIKKIFEEKNLLDEVKKFEFHTRVKVQIGEKPESMLKIIAKAFGGQYLPESKMNRLNELFVTELQPFCIRLYPKSYENFIGDLRRKDDWIDIYMFPYIPNTRYLSVWIVFRNKQLEKVIDFASRVEEKIKEIVKVIADDAE